MLFKKIDVRAVCDFYQLDATQLVRELSEFRAVYGEVHHLIVVDYRQTKRGKTSGTCSDEDEKDDGQESGYARWIPYSLLLQLSGFPNLTCICKILVSVAVTSCTADRFALGSKPSHKLLMDGQYYEHAPWAVLAEGSCPPCPGLAPPPQLLPSFFLMHTSALDVCLIYAPTTVADPEATGRDSQWPNHKCTYTSDFCR